MLPTIQRATDDHVFLTGRPPMTEFLGFIVAQTVNGETANRKALAETWREANDHIKTLEAEDPGAADDATVEPMSGAMASRAEKVLNSPVVQQSYALVPITIGMVDLDEVVVHQKAINLGHVDAIRGRVSASPTDEEIFDLCFPIDRSLDPQAHAQQIAPNAWAFVSPSNDFRMLAPTVVSGDSISGWTPQGVPVAVLAIPVGYGVNVMAAAKIEGRLLLTNGSHRAYMLREAGITRVPCLIQEVSRRDEIEVLGVQELQQDPDASWFRLGRPCLRTTSTQSCAWFGPCPEKCAKCVSCSAWRLLICPRHREWPDRADCGRNARKR